MGIDWTKHREDHTRNALRFAQSIDFPAVLIVIYYPDMAAHNQMPSHYVVDENGTKPVTRKQANDFHGMKILYLPDGTAERMYQ